jgi:hypothetical protein
MQAAIRATVSKNPLRWRPRCTLIADRLVFAGELAALFWHWSPVTQL